MCCELIVDVLLMFQKDAIQGNDDPHKNIEKQVKHFAITFTIFVGYLKLCNGFCSIQSLS